MATPSSPFRPTRVRYRVLAMTVAVYMSPTRELNRHATLAYRIAHAITQPWAIFSSDVRPGDSARRDGPGRTRLVLLLRQREPCRTLVQFLTEAQSLPQKAPQLQRCIRQTTVLFP